MLIWWIVGYLIVGYVTANISWHFHQRSKDIKQAQKKFKKKGVLPATYAVMSVWVYALLFPVGVLGDVIELGGYLLNKVRA